MADHSNVTSLADRYTRLDAMALRYRLNRFPTSFIMERLFHEAALADREIETPAQLESWLDNFLKVLTDIAKAANPHIAPTLEQARRFQRWPKEVIEFLFKMGEKKYSVPQLSDPVSMWFKPNISKVLKDEGLNTIATLKDYMVRKGAGWFRPIPRIGVNKSKTIENWFIKNSDHLGPLVLKAPPARLGQYELGARISSRTLVPLDYIGS